MHNYCVADRYTQCFHDCPGCNHSYFYRYSPDADSGFDRYREERHYKKHKCEEEKHCKQVLERR